MSESYRCKVLRFIFADSGLTCTKMVTDRAGAGFQPNSVGKGSPFPPSPQDIGRIELDAELLRLLMDIVPSAVDADEKLRKHLDKNVEALAKQLGETLYGILFCDPDVKREFDDTVKGLNRPKVANSDVADARLNLLRIEFDFLGLKKNPNISTWPWEYIREPDPEDRLGPAAFLATRAQIILNRRGGSTVENFRIPKPKILLIISRPGDEGPVQGGAVLEFLQDLHDRGEILLLALVEPDADKGLVSRDYRPTASWHHLEAALESARDREQHPERWASLLATLPEDKRRGVDENWARPDIIHFIGHGRMSFNEHGPYGELAFVNQNGEAEWISAQPFAQAVRRADPKLVFLQACESARASSRANMSGVAQQLEMMEIPAIVAMQAKVRNGAADAFATAFYKELCKQVPIDIAVHAGRDAILRATQGNFGLSNAQAFAFGIPIMSLKTYQNLISPAPKPERDKLSISPRPTILPDLPEKCLGCESPIPVHRRSANACGTCGSRLRCRGCMQPIHDTVELCCTNCEEPLPRFKAFNRDEVSSIQAQAPSDASRTGASPANTLYRPDRGRGS